MQETVFQAMSLLSGESPEVGPRSTEEEPQHIPVDGEQPPNEALVPHLDVELEVRLGRERLRARRGGCLRDGGLGRGLGHDYESAYHNQATA